MCVCLKTGWICLQTPFLFFKKKKRFGILKPFAATSSSPQRAAAVVFTRRRTARASVRRSKTSIQINPDCWSPTSAEKDPLSAHVCPGSCCCCCCCSIRGTICDLDAHRHFLSAFPRGFVHTRVNKFKLHNAASHLGREHKDKGRRTEAEQIGLSAKHHSRQGRRSN